MGYIEDVNAMELSDDIKNQLISAHQKDIDPLKSERDSLKAKSKIDETETKISKWGLSEISPGIAKYVRRALLSPDSEQPGAILLSDNEMGLSGDLATGATGREEITVAKVINDIFEMWPKKDDGKLNFSDQMINADNHSRPENGDDDPSEKSEKARNNLSKVTGKSTKRSGKRYGQEVTN